jgi:hypothetical protein
MALGLAIAALAAVIWLASIWRAFKGEKVLQQDLAWIREALADTATERCIENNRLFGPEPGRNDASPYAGQPRVVARDAATRA